MDNGEGFATFLETSPDLDADLGRAAFLSLYRSIREATSCGMVSISGIEPSEVGEGVGGGERGDAVADEKVGSAEAGCARSNRGAKGDSAVLCVDDRGEQDVGDGGGLGRPLCTGIAASIGTSPRLGWAPSQDILSSPLTGGVASGRGIGVQP